MLKEELDFIRELNISDEEKLKVFKETKFKELEEGTRQEVEKTNQIKEKTEQMKVETEHLKINVGTEQLKIKVENNTSRLKTLSECVMKCINDYIEYKHDDEVKKYEEMNEEMLNQLDLAQISDENKQAFKVS